MKKKTYSNYIKMCCSIILICAGLFINSKPVHAQVINTNELTTDKSRYAPGDIVTFNATVLNYTAGLTVSIEYWSLTNKIKEESHPVATANIAWNWTTPSVDFKGYTILVKLFKGSILQSSTTIGVDVSSDWKKFPRYGFLSDYNFVSEGQQDAVMNNLQRHHINGLQFYDWMEKQHIPLPGSTSPPSQWKALNEVAVSLGTVQNYITKAHNRNMMAMWYDLVYGALESNSNNILNEGVQPTWTLYTDQTHTSRWNYDLSFWNGKRIYFQNPGNPDWQNYFFKNMDYLYKNLAFDGFHMDQIGDFGTKYDYNGNSVPYYSGFGNFIGNYLSRFPGKRAVMNAVSQYAQNFIAPNKVDFAYTECWNWNDWEKTYSNLASLIRNNFDLSNGKSSVLAAYINYKNPNSNYFNDASVLRANAVIFAWGGAHIELGEHMLSNEFYLDGRMQMSGNLKNELVKYYDFLTAYENLLRDGGTISEKPMNNSNIVNWSNISTGKIATFNVSTPNEEVYHFLNFNGSDNLLWRDDNGSAQHEPSEQTNLNISFTVSSAISKLFWASPDQNSIELKEIPFTQNGNTVICTLPSVKYWTMLVADKTPCTSNCPTKAINQAMYVAGSFAGSNWNPSNFPMSLTADYTWKISRINMAAGNFELKFSNTSSWSGTDWGLSSGNSGTAKVSTGVAASNINFSIPTQGNYSIVFNDKSLSYSIVPDGAITSDNTLTLDNAMFTFPNPVVQDLTIGNPGHLFIKTLTLVNMLGQEKMIKRIESSENAILVDIDGLSPGVYFSTVNHAEGTVYFKIIKK
jgi:dextranase